MLSTIRRCSVLLAFVASSGLVAAQGDVLIVGPGGFSEIQAAVAAANDGRPGGATPPTRGVLGAIGPSGVLTAPYELPLLPPGIDAADFWFQGLAQHANGKRSLGSFSAVTVLDSVLQRPAR